MGLAIGCTLIVSTVFLVLTYLAGNFKAAEYLGHSFCRRVRVNSQFFARR